MFGLGPVMSPFGLGLFGRKISYFVPAAVDELGGKPRSGPMIMIAVLIVVVIDATVAVQVRH